MLTGRAIGTIEFGFVRRDTKIVEYVIVHSTSSTAQQKD